MYLLSARLCVLSAQHMNTRSYNVYAEKHMFDFYNKFLRIFVLIVNVCSIICVKNEQMCVRINTYLWKFVRIYECLFTWYLKTMKCLYILKNFQIKPILIQKFLKTISIILYISIYFYKTTLPARFFPFCPPVFYLFSTCY